MSSITKNRPRKIFAQNVVFSVDVLLFANHVVQGVISVADLDKFAGAKYNKL